MLADNDEIQNALTDFRLIFMKKQSKRATFEDVKNAQKKLLALLDKLVTENRPLLDTERTNYFNCIALATLGVGTELGERVMLQDDKGYVHDLGNIEYVLGWMAYQDKETIKIGIFPDIEEVKISKIWFCVRDMFLMVRGHALKMSVKISQEQIKLGRAAAGHV